MSQQVLNKDIKNGIRKLVDLVYASLDEELGIFKLGDYFHQLILLVNQNQDSAQLNDLYTLIFEELIEHFYHVLQLQEKQLLIRSNRASTEQLLNLMPNPLLLVSAKGSVLFTNLKARQKLGDRQIQALNNNPSLLPGKAQEQPSTGWNTLWLGDNQPITTYVKPIAGTQNSSQPEMYLVSILDHANLDLNRSTLLQSFELSRTEANIAALMCSGMTRKEIAIHEALSEETIKTHIKHIFQKLNASSQEAVTESILKSPAILNLPEKPIDLPATNAEERETQILELPDGRRLSFSETGPEYGAPVIFCHNYSGSRFQIHPNKDLLWQQNIRLIIPDRPGFGHSDYYRGRKLADWPKDLAHLLNYLYIDQCRVVADGDGTAYGMAAGYYLSDKVIKLALTSPFPIVRRTKDLLKFGKGPYISLFFIGRKSPTLAHAILHSLVNKSPEDIIYHSMHHKLAPIDKQLFEDPTFFNFLSRSLAASTHQDARTWASDIYIIANHWGFEPEEVHVDIDVWYSDNNFWIPQCFTESFVAEIPSATMHFIPGETHWLAFRYWDQVLDKLLA